MSGFIPSPYSVSARNNTITIVPPKKAQWDILNSYIEKLFSASPPAIDRILLNNVDKSVLATLLAKKRSELDILAFEATPSSSPRTPCHLVQDSLLKFPNYDIGTYRSSHGEVSTTWDIPSLTIANLAESPDCSHARADPGRCPHGNTIADFISYKRPSHIAFEEETISPKPPGVSPLSPTFGPRRGEVPSGTLERRHASQPVNHFDASTYAASQPPSLTDESGYNGSKLRRDTTLAADSRTSTEKRVLWEAAWKEIEANLEDYVGQFGSAESVGCGKEEIWRRILDISAEIGGLEGGKCYTGLS